jgi:thiamine-phosphate diphosphorylase
MPLIDVPTVHAVTDTRILSMPGFADRASAVLRALGSAVAIHLRGREIPSLRLHQLAEILAPLQAETGGWLVINDRVDVAMACGARGVQLAGHSMPVGDACDIAPALAVGASVHSGDAARSLAAAHALPDWLVAGNVFETPSHPGRMGRGISLIRDVAAAGIPVIAIGGLQPGHAAQLRAAGARGIATIRGIWDAEEPAKAAAQYLWAYGRSSTTR